ncbi:hypothetical protein [Clostridium sp. DJ247]|nr:hypothetical protein [Clostridium sp. DJ247]MBC2579910.1 hypothetical protein [Clostridium sp. DJ247]
MVGKDDFVPGFVLFENGHTHYYDFYTTEESGHRHHIKGVDQPAPGVR